MAGFEFKFIDGLIRKTLILGFFLIVALGLFAGYWMALSTIAGVATAWSNLTFVRWISKKMVDRAKGGNPSLWPWSALLLLKMVFLFGLVWYLIARIGIDALGFAAGFSVFLPAIGWQVWDSRNDEALIPPDEDLESDG